MIIKYGLVRNLPDPLAGLDYTLGPLANKYAETFSGGRYTTITLQNDTVLYRAGTANNPLGECSAMNENGK